MRTLTNQAVGAYGEKVVEAQLLRRGWTPSNVNASVKDAADFDIIAQKGGQVALLRVKTCGPGERAFQFHFRPSREIASGKLQKFDFTILVSMGSERAGDEFFVVPTGILRRQIDAHKTAYLAQPKRIGGQRKDTGHWTLYLAPLKGSGEASGRDFAAKWAAFRDAWGSLEAD